MLSPTILPSSFSLSSMSLHLLKDVFIVKGRRRERKNQTSAALSFWIPFGKCYLIPLCSDSLLLFEKINKSTFSHFLTVLLGKKQCEGEQKVLWRNRSVSVCLVLSFGLFIPVMYLKEKSLWTVAVFMQIHKCVFFRFIWGLRFKIE